MHIESDVFRNLPRLETLGLRDNDLDCLPIEELSNLRSLRTVRVDNNPWLCECRQRMERFFRDRTVVQEEQCTRECDRRSQCMTQIALPLLPAYLTPQHLSLYERDRLAIRGNEFRISVLSSLDRLPDTVSMIELSGMQIETIPRYTFFRFGNSLRSLDLNDCGISTIERGAFAGLHRLQRLSLIGNKISTVGADWFRDLVGLQQLVLQHNAIEEIERTAFWHVGNSLRHLDIRNNRFRCIGVEELSELKRLERLDATGNPWMCSCRRNLQSFLTDRKIGYEISAGRCYENAQEVPEIAEGGRHQSAEGDRKTGKVHWTSFEDTIHQWNLTIERPGLPPPTAQIYIERPQQSHRGSCRADKKSAEIYSCTGISSIEELNVIPPTAHTIRVILSRLKTIPANTLRRFNVYLTRLEFRDCAVEKIENGAFADLYNLEYLSLRGNQLDSVTADTVRGLTNLRYLDLSSNHIYRITNDVFDAMPYLASLDVSENRMNCIGVEQIDQRLSRLAVMKVSSNPWSCLCGTKLAGFLDSRRIHYDRESLLDANQECYKGHRPSLLPTAQTVLPTAQTVLPTAPATAVPTNDTVEGTCLPYEDATGVRYRCISGNLLLLQTIPTYVTGIEFDEGHLPHIPPGTFARFTNLQELVIRNSGLRSMEKGSFDGLGNLKILTIQDNPLETVGSSWLNLRNLDRLDLRGNSIRYVAPGAFRELERLSYLNLEGNDLKCVFTSDLNEMPNVHVIEFAGNPLKWRCRVELEQFLESRKIRFVRIENSCEGKKLVRNLLYQNQTEFNCGSECSAAAEINSFFLAALNVLPLIAMWIH